MSFFALISLIILFYSHHFYDDEIFNIQIINNYTNFFQLFKHINSIDVTPPLSYIFNLFFLKLFNSYELIIVPTILLTSYSLFLFYRCSNNYIEDKYGKVLLFLFTFFSPPILMWGISLRWYAYWFPLFLIVFTFFFYVPIKRYHLILLILLLSLMTSISYLTFIILVPFFILWFLKNRFNKTKEIFFLIVAYFLINSYQIYNFLHVHINNSAIQRYNIIYSMLNSVSAMYNGGTVFFVDTISVVQMLICIVLTLYIFLKYGHLNDKQKKFIFPIIFFLVITFVIMVLSGIGGKYRNGLFLNIIFIFIVSYFFQFIKKEFKLLILLIGVIFITISLYNLIFHINTAKNSFNLPVNRVINLISNTRNKDLENDIFIFTHDPSLEFELKRKNYKVLSLNYLNNENKSYLAKKGDFIFLIETYQGSIGKQQYKEIKQINSFLIEKCVKDIKVVNFGYDKNYKFKSWIAKILSKRVPIKLPEYLVVLKYGIVKEEITLINYKYYFP
jgi:hypothetical protein